MSARDFDRPLPMSELVERAARAIPKNDIVELATIRASWERLVAAPLRDHCEALAIHDGELILGVDAGPWLSAAKLASKQILTALAVLGDQAPTTVRVVRKSS